MVMVDWMYSSLAHSNSSKTLLDVYKRTWEGYNQNQVRLLKMTNKRNSLGQGALESYIYAKYRVMSIIFNINLKKAVTI